MKQMVMDLHCDTLTRDQFPGGEMAPGRPFFDQPGCQLCLSRLPAGAGYVQCFAVFIPDRLRGAEGAAYFDRCAARYHRQMAGDPRAADCRTMAQAEAALAEGKLAGFLTVEGGSALGGKLERVDELYRAGVRMMTLTWNGKNELASGHDTGEGFTAFGREAVAALEERGILVDVSHLNDRGFEELLPLVKKPFVASHSNARSVCGHRRNLPDAFIREIAERRCLIGLNYCRHFLSDDGRGDREDLWRHVARFLELGAGDCLALGSDFDGADIHPDLLGGEKSLALGDFLVKKGLTPAQEERILYGNARDFFARAFP